MRWFVFFCIYTKISILESIIHTMTITLNIHTTAHKNQIQKNQTRFTQRPRSQIRRPISQFTKKHASWERRRRVPFVANNEVKEGEERGLASVNVGRREHQHERLNHTRCGELRMCLWRRRRFSNHLPYLPRASIVVLRFPFVSLSESSII